MSKFENYLKTFDIGSTLTEEDMEKTMALLQIYGPTVRRTAARIDEFEEECYESRRQSISDFISLAIDYDRDTDRKRISDRLAEMGHCMQLLSVMEEALVLVKDTPPNGSTYYCGLVKVNGSMREQIEQRGILILRDLYIPLHAEVYCPAMVHDGVIDIPAGEWGKLAGICVILRSGAANGFTADCVKIVIGEKRPIGDGNSCADDPVDQVQIVQHQCVLIISHVERLLYAIR